MRAIRRGRVQVTPSSVALTRRPSASLCDGTTGRRHARAGDIRVFQGEAAGPPVGDRSGGDDPPGRRYHQVRPEAEGGVISRSEGVGLFARRGKDNGRL